MILEPQAAGYMLLSASQQQGGMSNNVILFFMSSLPLIIALPATLTTPTNATTLSTAREEDGDKWAMIYIVAVICMFGMGIVLLIGAQMSYNPHDSQVQRYLKQRTLLKDMKILQHIQRKKELAKRSSRLSYSQTVAVESDNLCTGIMDVARSPSSVKQSTRLSQSFPDLPSLFASQPDSDSSESHASSLGEIEDKTDFCLIGTPNGFTI